MREVKMNVVPSTARRGLLSLRTAGGDSLKHELVEAGFTAGEITSLVPTSELQALREHAARLEVVKRLADHLPRYIGAERRNDWIVELIAVIDGSTEIPQSIRAEFGL